MSKKRTNMIKVMMTDKEKEKVLNKVEELKSEENAKKINVSDLIRACIKNWIAAQEKIKDGNSMCFIPVSKEIIDNKRAMLELEDLSKDENISLHTRKILHEIAESMEWQVLFQLKEKYPDYNGFFNMSSLEEDI